MAVAPGAGAVRTIEVKRLGLVPYVAALELQRRLVEERQAQRIPDQLLLLQHPPVITLGVKVRDDRAHVLVGPDELARQGVELHETGRGGDVTFHGPGQLVGYPILDLNPDRRDVHRYVRDLEEVLIAVAASFGIVASRQPGLTGAWVGDEKLSAIGVRIARWVTSHGFALNVSADLRYFDLIVPCGLTDKGLTSLERQLGRAVPMDEVETATIAAFEAVFGRVSA